MRFTVGLTPKTVALLTKVKESEGGLTNNEILRRAVNLGLREIEAKRNG